MNLEAFLLINFPTTGQTGFIIITNICKRREANRKIEKEGERRREEEE